MCGRYVLVQKVELLEKRFNVRASDGFDFQPNYNIAPGSQAPIITCENPRQMELCRFGMTPFWSKKALMLINARAEGDHYQTILPQTDPLTALPRIGRLFY